jgi:hypothetical protein
VDQVSEGQGGVFETGAENGENGVFGRAHP